MMLRMKTGLGLLAVASSLMLALPASAAGVLAAQNGMTLYTFDKDSDGKSACYDACAKNWPPYIAAAGEAMRANPRAEPATPDQDPAAFVDAARRDLEAARDAHPQ